MWKPTNLPETATVSAAFGGTGDLAKVQPVKGIEDFGAKIPGARKTLAGGGQCKTASSAMASLSSAWPAPAYDRLIADGVPERVIATVRALRDVLHIRPTSQAAGAAWAETVENAKAASDDLIAGREYGGDLASILVRRVGRDVAERAMLNSELYLAVGHRLSLRGVQLSYLRPHVPTHPAWWLWGPRALRAELPSGQPVFQGYASKEAALAALAAFIDTLDASRRRLPKRTAFCCYVRRDGTAFVAPKSARYPLILQEFPNEAAAFIAIRDDIDSLEALWAATRRIPTERRKGNRSRVGRNWRAGHDVTPDMFDAAFAFRGVQFGNYVEQSRRQRDLNDAHDALLDLAAALEIPSRALSLSGELALAFGARGRNGHYSAHYESSDIVINLTKTRGPGSLAHERWHALDNALARWAGAPEEMMTDWRRAPCAGLDAEVFEAVRVLRQRLATSPAARRSRALDRRRARPYFGLPVEISARAFEAYVVAKLEAAGTQNDYLANIRPADLWDVKPAADETETYPYPLAGEAPPIAEAFDVLFGVLARRIADGQLRLEAAGGQSSA